MYVIVYCVYMYMYTYVHVHTYSLNVHLSCIHVPVFDCMKVLSLRVVLPFVLCCVVQVSIAQDHLVFHDSVLQVIGQSQDYSLMRYLDFVSVAFHFLFAAPSKPPVKYPHSSFEVCRLYYIHALCVCTCVKHNYI